MLHGANQEYKKTVKAFEQALQSVREAVSPIIHTEGEMISVHGYSSLNGIKIGGKLTEEEAIQFGEQVQAALAQNLNAVAEEKDPMAGFIARTGSMSDNFSIPIVDIPSISYDKQGMSEKQLEVLKRYEQILRNAGSVMAQIDFRPASVKGGLMPMHVSGEEPEIPESIIMENKPDTKIQLFFNPGFDGEREMAAKVIAAMMQTPIIQAKRAGLSKGNTSPPLPPR